jgi:hypothetical protein
MMEREMPNSGMRIWTGAGGGKGEGDGVIEGTGVVVGVCVGGASGVLVGEGVQVGAGAGMATRPSACRYRFWPISQVFSSE